MTKYISEPETFTTGTPSTGGAVEELVGDYAARGPYGSVVYGEGWRESDFPRDLRAQISATSHEYGVMQVAWHLPVENDDWDRFAVTRSTIGAPAAIEEGKVIIDLPRASGVETTLDAVPSSTSVAYALFVRLTNRVWVRVAATTEVPVVQDRGMLFTLMQAIPNHNFPNDDLERFLDIFAFELSKEHTALDAVLDKHNAFATPQSYVEALLAQYGFGSVVGLGGRRSRNFLEALYIQRRHRGTGASIATIAAALAGGDARVTTGVNLMHDRNHSRFAYTLGSWVGRNGAVPEWSDPDLADPFPPRTEGIGYLKVEGGNNDGDGNTVIMSGDSRLDAIPIDAGQHYSASAYVRGDARNVRMVVEWLDVNGDVLPTVTGTGVGPGPFGEYLIGAGKDGRDGLEGGLPIYADHTAGSSWERISVRQAAPVDAVFARPGFVVEDSIAGEFFGLSDVQFEARYVPTAFEEPRLVLVDLLPHRTNYIRNPSMERGTYLWLADNADLVRSPRTWIGSFSGRMTVTGAGPAKLWTNTILHGSHAAWAIHLQLSPNVHAATDSRNVRLQIEWLDENEDVLFTETADDSFRVGVGRWVRPSMIGSDAYGASAARCAVVIEDAQPGDALLFDAALMEESTVVRQYFDGGLLDTSYYWAGEPHFSESHFLASKDAVLTRSAAELMRWLPGDRQVSVDAPPLVLVSSQAALIEESSGYWTADDYDDLTTSYVDQSGRAAPLNEPGGPETPMRLVYEGDSYLWLPGTDDDYAQHETSLDLSGVTDATVTIDVAPAVLGVDQDIYGQWSATGGPGEQNFIIGLGADDTIRFRISDGTAATTYSSTAPIASAAAQRVELRAELVDGDVTFFENDVQLGDVVPGTFAGFQISTARQRVSGQYLGDMSPFAGRVYRAEFSAANTLGLFEVDLIDQEGGEDWFVERSVAGHVATVVDEDFGTVVLFDQDQFLFTNHDAVYNVGEEGLTTLFVGRVHEEYDDAVLFSKKSTGVLEAAGLPYALLPGTAGSHISTSDEGNGDPRGLYLAGVSGSYAITPTHADLNITGDLDLRAQVTLDDWTPNFRMAIVGRWQNAYVHRSYLLAMASSAALGKLELWIHDGTNGTAAVSSVATGIADGETYWVRATYRASDQRVQFFISPDGVVWTQLGTDVTHTITSINSGTGDVEIGSNNIGTANNLKGIVHRAQALDGIDGTLSFDVDFTDETQGWSAGDTDTDTGVDATGKAITIHGAGSRVLSPIDLTGDIDLRFYGVEPDQWEPLDGNARTLVSRYQASQRAFDVRLSDAGVVWLTFTLDGSTPHFVGGSDPIPGIDGEPEDLRVTRTAADGVVRYYRRVGGSWVQSGIDRPSPAGPIYYSGTAPIEIGQLNDGTRFVGKMRKMEMYDGIDGELVSSYDIADASENLVSDQISSATGEVWTYNGGAAAYVDVDDTASGWSIGTSTDERVLVDFADGLIHDQLESSVLRPAQDLVLVTRIAPDEINLAHNITEYAAPRTVPVHENTDPLIVGALDTFGVKAARMEWKAAGVWNRVLTDDEVTLLSAPYLS